MTDRFHFAGQAVELKPPSGDPATAARQLRFYVELARRMGLKTTSAATQPKETKLPLMNPYERRGDNARGRGRAVSAQDLAVDLLAEEPSHRRSPQSGRVLHDVAAQRLEMADEVDHAGLTLRDLEELVARKVRRARRDGDDAAYLRGQGELVEAQRRAWEEGRRMGASAARRELLEAIDAMVGGEVRDMHNLAVKITEADPKSKAGRELRTVANLLKFARSVAVLTDSLVHKHHDGFFSPDGADDGAPF